ncbi:MAG: 5'-nucleotidase C-terminal domain-containing protein [Prevotellaceae bacterium]|jgi:2',3'-cyclic-nucleotide 2'-phosphodiesterase (5'-nucleotidase family)|nr:5'-nucleotidase C-terminal domain-containing protein [Prevotellaceae bacterium]
MFKKIIFSICTVLVLFGCEPQKTPTIVASKLVDVVVSEKSKTNSMNAWIKPYKTALDKIMGVHIGVSSMEMSAGLPESLLGTFVTSVMADYANNHGKKFDCVITNIGGLRENLPKGQLTVNEVYKMFPFDNELIILTLSGNNMEELCQIIASKGGEITSGIEMKIVSSQNKKIGENIKIGGKEINKNRNYKVLTTDYLSFGNDLMFPMADYSEIYTFGQPLREIIIDFIKNKHKKGKEISASLKNQVYVEKM